MPSYHGTPALSLSDRIYEAYCSARPSTRRLFNQAIFEWIRIDVEQVADVKYTEQFAALLSDDLASELDYDDPTVAKNDKTSTADKHRGGLNVEAMVRLSGACSNQSQLAVVRKAAEARSKLTTEPVAESRRDPLRQRLGAIQEAILDAMSSSSKPLRPTEIRRQVIAGTNREISYDTVASFLSVASRSVKWPVQRVGPGLYLIVQSPD
ncbi:MAG: hypothetical protein ACPGYP_06035 [Solirubrobacterales bacterium]